MRRLALCIIMSVIASELLAQSDTTDVKAEYDFRKLTIVSAYEMDPTSRLWGVTEGYNRINEPTFLRLTGYPDESRKAARNLALQNGLWISFGGLLVGGLVTTLVPIWSDSANGSATNGLGWQFWLGTGMMAGSLVPVYIVSYFVPPRITPLGRAQQIARAYNEQLIESIYAEAE